LIGTGREKHELPESYFEKFKKFGIKVDVVATFEACSHFNFCSEEQRDVCAFMIP
jgi:NADH dehydrogenase [ubiquinone] 1 alpha subcomplex assembly factor 3